MSRSSNVFRRTTNLLMTHLKDQPVGAVVPSETALSRTLDVSRTTVRRVLQHAQDNGILATSGAGVTIRRHPVPEDFFSDTQISSRPELIENRFMDLVRRGDLRPGQQFSEADLARLSQTSTASVREFLIGFSQFGLIERRPRGGWRLCSFDEQFAKELSEMRALIELAAFDRFLTRDMTRQSERALKAFYDRHIQIRNDLETLYVGFPDLDKHFHAWIVSGMENRFASSHLEVISFVFHYHYQYEKAGEQKRNSIAINEHLMIIESLRSGDRDGARAALVQHLKTSETLLVSTLWPARA
ncbi:MAG: GntR family transcriptional regulator [Telmatospirillum sp.]|nr:GntR family transcriptional regulator [Telmatospirillum sp.]